MKTLPHVIALSAIVAGFLTLAGRPIAAAAEPGKPIELFNGKDLTGWRFHAWPWGTAEDLAASRSKWKVGTASLDPKHPEHLLVTPGGHDLVNVAAHHGDSCDVYTDAKFGDAIVDLEFMVARGSNSGVALLGVYEIQILDSYGIKQPDAGDMGAVYNRLPPRVNASKKPGEWQHLVIDYRAPRFNPPYHKTANARIKKATLNGQVILENDEINGITAPFLAKGDVAVGAILLQGDHGPVAFRNIKITPVHDE
jgi:hypothetical protein